MVKKQSLTPQSEGVTIDGAMLFARVPYSLLKDRKLKPIDVTIAGLILEWMPDTKRSAWVFNGILADRAGVAIRCVQYSLRRLSEGGWFSFTKADNRGRRKITRMWHYPKESHAPKCTPAVHENAPSGVHENAWKVKQRSQNNEEDSLTSPPDLASEITLYPTDRLPVRDDQSENAPDPDLDVDDTATRDRLSRGLKVLAAGKGRRGIQLIVERTATLLAEANFDDHSLAMYCGELWRVVNGDRAPDVIMAAFDATQNFVVEHDIANLGSHFFGAVRNIEQDAALDEVEQAIRKGKGSDFCASPLDSRGAKSLGLASVLPACAYAPSGAQATKPTAEDTFDARAAAEAVAMKTRRVKWLDPEHREAERLRYGRINEQRAANAMKLGIRPTPPTPFEDTLPCTPEEARAALTDEQRARLATFGPGKQAKLLEELAMRDPIITPIVHRTLAPPRLRKVVDACGHEPRTTEEQ